MHHAPPSPPHHDLASLTAATPSPLLAQLLGTIADQGGWIAFDTFMAMALYTPHLGYYSSHRQKFGPMPTSGSDFITAPELSPLFGQAIGKQLHQALHITGTRAIWEFGAGTGALALQVLQTLDILDAHDPLGTHAAAVQYHIVELSGDLRDRQQSLLSAYRDRVQWHDSLPPHIEGVVLGNEVLDAMPVQLAVRHNSIWHERGVGVHEGTLCFIDRPLSDVPASACASLWPTLNSIPGHHDYVTELPTHGLAFIATLAERLTKGAAFFIDYGFPAHEFYHPERHMGTLVCHHRHHMDGNPLVQVGEKDITAHVDFTALALAWQDWQEAGDQPTPAIERGTLGFCSQGRFLLNCGLGELLVKATPAEQSAALKLIHEHEMGELFKVIGLYVGQAWSALGFVTGDRSHAL